MPQRKVGKFTANVTAIDMSQEELQKSGKLQNAKCLNTACENVISVECKGCVCCCYSVYG